MQDNLLHVEKDSADARVLDETLGKIQRDIEGN